VGDGDFVTTRATPGVGLASLSPLAAFDLASCLFKLDRASSRKLFRPPGVRMRAVSVTGAAGVTGAGTVGGGGAESAADLFGLDFFLVLVLVVRGVVPSDAFLAFGTFAFFLVGLVLVLVRVAATGGGRDSSGSAGGEGGGGDGGGDERSDE
jgi:hypothetical protein